MIQSMRYENLTIDLYHNVMSRNIPHGHWIFNFILCYLISHNVFMCFVDMVEIQMYGGCFMTGCELFLLRFREIISRFREIISRFREIISRFRGIIYHFREIISRFCEIISRFR